MKTKELVYKKLQNLTKEKISDDSDIYNIGIDSLDLVELVTEVEDEFNVMISDEELESFKTVNDVIKAFDNAIKENG